MVYPILEFREEKKTFAKNDEVMWIFLDRLGLVLFTKPEGKCTYRNGSLAGVQELPLKKKSRGTRVSVTFFLAKQFQ